MAKAHTIACGVTYIPRVFVKRGDARFRQNAAVIVAGTEIGEVYKYKGAWNARNTINSRTKLSTHKTAIAAVKALVCGQVRSEIAAGTRSKG